MSHRTKAYVKPKHLKELKEKFNGSKMLKTLDMLYKGQRVEFYEILDLNMPLKLTILLFLGDSKSSIICNCYKLLYAIGTE